MAQGQWHISTPEVSIKPGAEEDPVIPWLYPELISLQLHDIGHTSSPIPTLNFDSPQQGNHAFHRTN